MTNSVKKTNAEADVYKDERVIEFMIEHYTGAEDSDEARAKAVEEIVAATGKSPVSVRGKLHALGVYIPKVVAKKGNVITKDKLADKIAAIAKEFYNVNISEGEVESLAKANKTVLNKLIKMLDMVDFVEDIDFSKASDEAKAKELIESDGLGEFGKHYDDFKSTVPGTEAPKVDMSPIKAGDVISMVNGSTITVV